MTREQDFLAEKFEQNRGHLKAVAYRMLGSAGEADDAVQEAWLRLGRSDANAIDNLGGWLTTVVARVCLDMLRSRNSRREEPLTAAAPGKGPGVTRRRSSDEEISGPDAHAAGTEVPYGFVVAAH